VSRRFSSARLSASGESSMPTTSSYRPSLARLSAMHPPPVPTSATRPPGTRARTSSTSPSVSGRGMSARRSERSVRCRNPAQPVRRAVYREIDSVVGHAALGKVVGPDLRRAVAGADHRAAVARARRLLLGDHPVEQPSAQHLHRLHLVLKLRFLVLLAHHHAG